MTLLELLKEIRDMNALDRVRRIKVGDVELELAAPETQHGETKSVEIPIPQEHGIGTSDAEAKLIREIEERHAMYGASQGGIPSDYAGS